MPPSRTSTPSAVPAAGKSGAVGRELAALFDGAVHPVLAVRAHRVVHANPAFRELWGAATPLRGKSVWELCAPGHRDDVEAWCKQPNPPGSVTLTLDTRVPVTVSATVVELALHGRQLRVFRVHDLPKTRRHLPVTPDPALPAVPERAMWDLLQDAMLGVWLGDLEGRTVLVNTPAAMLLGHTVEDLYTVTLGDLLKLDGSPQQPGAHHVSFTRPDGVEIQVEVLLAPFKGEDGRVAGSFALLRDVTAQAQMVREVRRSERRFRAMAETAPCAVAIMAAGSGPFYEVNNTASTVFGYRRDEWLGGAVKADALYANAEDARTVLQRVRAQGRLVDVPVTMRRRDGETFPALLNLTRFFLDGEERLAVALLDLGAVTPGAPVPDRAWDVVPLLLEAVQGRMASLHGHARRHGGAALAQGVAQAGQAIARLLRGFSMLGAVSSTQPDHQAVDLPALWAQVLAEEQPYLNGATVTVELPAVMNVRGDARLLRVALRSMLQGVLHGTGTAVLVGTRADPSPGRAVLVWEVVGGANGAAAPDEAAATRAMALAVARAVVTRHGGTVWEEASGARACFSLPLHAPNG
jgi:PAS domain S-box-containing protein